MFQDMQVECPVEVDLDMCAFVMSEGQVPPQPSPTPTPTPTQPKKPREPSDG